MVSKERRSKTGRQSYEHFPPRGRHTKNERANEQLQLCAGRYAQEADIIHLASASCQTFLSVPLSLFVDDSQEKTSYVAHKHTFSTIRKSCSQLLHVWLRVYVSGCNSCCQVIVVVVTVCARRPKKEKYTRRPANFHHETGPPQHFQVTDFLALHFLNLLFFVCCFFVFVILLVFITTTLFRLQSLCENLLNFLLIN